MLNVSDLERTIQGLRALRPASARPVDWPTLERSLGVGLPADFKEFAGAYPPVEIDEFLRIWSPAPGREEEFVEGVRYGLDILRDLRESGDTEDYTACCPGASRSKATSSTGARPARIRSSGRWSPAGATAPGGSARAACSRSWSV
jgi:hypothetical protein